MDIKPIDVVWTDKNIIFFDVDIVSVTSAEAWYASRFIVSSNGFAWSECSRSERKIKSKKKVLLLEVCTQ